MKQLALKNMGHIIKTILICLISFQTAAATQSLLISNQRLLASSHDPLVEHNLSADNLVDVVHIDVDALLVDESYEFELPDGRVYFAVATHIGQVADNQWSWQGVLTEDGTTLDADFSIGEVNLNITNDLTSGWISLPHVTYKLIARNETESVIQKTDAVFAVKRTADNTKSSTALTNLTETGATLIRKVRPKIPRYFTTNANLFLIYGSGEFIYKMKAFEVEKAQTLKFEWATTVNHAVSGRWEVKDLATSTIVASNIVSPAPKVGTVRYFTIPADAFLFAEPPLENATFEVRIVPIDTHGNAIGSGSGTVKVTQLASKNVPPITQFNDGARFPKIELVSFDPQFGQVPLTQLFYEYADVKVSVKNNSKTKTDPMWLTIKDNSLLFRQQSLLSLPELQPGQTIYKNIRLNAILPPVQSQAPGAEQHRLWLSRYDDRCGAELRSFLEWRGPASQTPMNATQERFLVEPEWEDYALSPPNRRICANGQCVKTCAIEKNIRKMLDGNTVGYSFFLGQWPHSGAGGMARKGDDGELPFTPKTKMTVASVSKLITAIGALRILEQNNVAVTDPIGPYLPADWDVDPYLASVTFGQYLSQRSGIMDYGNVEMSFDQLQFFFEQELDPNAQPQCTGASAAPRSQPVDQSMPGNCYSNYNTAIFRILLPRVAGLPIDTNPATRAQTYADQYETLINQHVFARVGATGTACRSLALAPHAFAYNFGSDKRGMDWGDVSAQCGAAGWYLSVEDMGKVLLSINARDGKILRETPRFPGDPVPSQFDQLRTMRFGLDINWPDWMEKNGGWSGCNGHGGCGTIATSAAIFGPGALPNPNVIGILFTNSDIKYPKGCNNKDEDQTNNCMSPRSVLRKAYDDALTPQ